MEPFRQRIYCRIDRTIHEVHISFQISCKVFLGLLPQPFTQKESIFSFKLFKRYIDCSVFLHVRTDHDSAKQFFRRMQKILWDREVMERKPN